MCDNGPNICDSCQWVPGLTGNEGMHLFPFQILPPLTEQFLMGSRVAHKVGKPGCRQLSTDSIALRALPQFLRSKEEFALRVPREALCWLLGTSVQEIGILHAIEQVAYRLLRVGFSL